jgi:hypothetical protein
MKKASKKSGKKAVQKKQIVAAIDALVSSKQSIAHVHAKIMELKNAAAGAGSASAGKVLAPAVLDAAAEIAAAPGVDPALQEDPALDPAPVLDPAPALEAAPTLEAAPALEAAHPSLARRKRRAQKNTSPLSDVEDPVPSGSQVQAEGPAIAPGGEGSVQLDSQELLNPALYKKLSSVQYKSLFAPDNSLLARFAGLKVPFKSASCPVQSADSYAA